LEQNSFSNLKKVAGEKEGDHHHGEQFVSIAL